MYPLKNNSEATLLREREGKMWVNRKGPRHGQEGAAGRGASEKLWEGWAPAVLTSLQAMLILLVSWPHFQEQGYRSPVNWIVGLEVDDD